VVNELNALTSTQEKRDVYMYIIRCRSICLVHLRTEAGASINTTWWAQLEPSEKLKGMYGNVGIREIGGGSGGGRKG